jgi:hypothetical protein
MASTIDLLNRMGSSRMAGGPEIFGIAVGDIATWVGAAMSFAAVVTALRLAGRESREKRRDSEDLERVFAPAVAEELLQIRWVCDQIVRIWNSDTGVGRRYRDMYEHLGSLRAPTLDLVASRDVYRGERGRKLMSLYAALLRQAADMPHFARPGNEDVLEFPASDIAGTAREIYQQAEAALTLIWQVTPHPLTPIPASHEPPGYRARVAG